MGGCYEPIQAAELVHVRTRPEWHNGMLVINWR